MKSLLRVTVFVIAIMISGTGAMAAEYLFAYKATTMNELEVDMGTFIPGDTLFVLVWVENLYDTTRYGELKFSLKGKGISGKDWWQDIEFDPLTEKGVGYSFPVDLQEIPEGVYNVTFKFREMVKGAKWQKLICRFQIIDTTKTFQAADAFPIANSSMQFNRIMK